jgi:hypothetical protein
MLPGSVPSSLVSPASACGVVKLGLATTNQAAAQASGAASPIDAPAPPGLKRGVKLLP